VCICHRLPRLIDFPRDLGRTMSEQSASKAPDSSGSAFISHASADADLAQELCARLESYEVRCWIAPRDVKPGRPYPSEIVYGIETTDALILLATPAAVSSENVLNELEQAHRLHKTLLTVMIGKPEISRQLSYYIARLHWIESSGASIGGAADRLAQTLHGKAPWEKVALRPSVRRWLYYGLWRPFLVPALSTAAVLLIAGLAALHFLRRQLNTDFRSLGWVTLDAQLESDGGPINIGARLWIANNETQSSEVRLQSAMQQENQSIQELDLSGKLSQMPTADGQSFIFRVPPDTNRLTTCLTVPSAKLDGRYRVTQIFLLAAPGGAGALNVAATGTPSVKKEDGSPCGH